MPRYKLSPLATLVESRLLEAAPQYAVFHRFTGQLIEPEPSVGVLLQAAKIGAPLSLDPDHLSHLGESGHQVHKLIQWELLIPDAHDPLASFVDYYVNRPMQNPAVNYQDETGRVIVVSISMAERIYSPERRKLPPVLEETFSELATKVLLAADGTKTLSQIYSTLRGDSKSLLDDPEFRDVIEFLTKPERQLIKFAPTPEGFANPFYPANLVPRNFYHAARWTRSEPDKSIGDFHVDGIEDALWEFDIIEPTVNHGLRFSTELLSGLDYGTRFCDAVFENAFPALNAGKHLEILEIGGGTGSFARSFIERARAVAASLKYHVMDLSPALAESQRRNLSDVEPEVTFIAQDATEFDLPGELFDLIISNEVIADFPVAMVERRSTEENALPFAGEGAEYVNEYALSVDNAPDRFYVNAGVFRFLERAWLHLKPAGTVILSEYGSESIYPTESFHLNHSEFSIHFGHVAECARKIGFQCRLQTLKEFLAIDDRKLVLNGREEHIRCLNCVFEKFGTTIPFALFTQTDFEARFGDLAARINLNPIRFLPLSSNFYYGAEIDQFLVLIMIKPTA
ncbi:MAG TPA: SAM-dependent methyltransferase [Pyrinomonadaceae bacterium]|jgi:SAM-dependent methyltransferase